jgi:hypothetical protein
MSIADMRWRAKPLTPVFTELREFRQMRQIPWLSRIPCRLGLRRAGFARRIGSAADKNYRESTKSESPKIRDSFSGCSLPYGGQVVGNNKRGIIDPQTCQAKGMMPQIVANRARPIRQPPARLAPKKEQ